MRSNTIRTRLLKVFVVSLMLVPMGNTLASTHVVKFGGSAGFKYAPASLSVAVGDTVKWEGDFNVHPISSTTIPSGARTWHVASGSSFSYTVTMTGAYNYKCDLHTGMTGDFQAAATGINQQVLRVGPQTGYLTVSPGSVRFFAQQTGSAKLQIIDLNGREKTTLLDRVVPQGTYSIPLVKIGANGVYYIRLTFNDKASEVKFVSVH